MYVVQISLPFILFFWLTEILDCNKDSWVVLQRDSRIPNDADGSELDEFFMEYADTTGRSTFIYAITAFAEIFRLS